MSRSTENYVEPQKIRAVGRCFSFFKLEAFFQVPAVCHEATFPASPHAMNLSSNAWDLAILPVFLGFGAGNRRVLLQVEDCCNDCQSGMVGNMLDCLK